MGHCLTALLLKGDYQKDKAEKYDFLDINLKYQFTLLLFFFSTLLFGQSAKLYTSINDALQQPLDVIYLTLDFRVLPAKDAARLATLKNLKVLHLNYFKNDTIPNSVFQLKNLRELRIIGASFFGDYKPKTGGKYYPLRAIPSAIGNLTQLEILDLSHHTINYLPSTIGQLTRLKVLNLGHNVLEKLPETIAQLSQLRILYLNWNKLDKANLTVIKPLSALVELDLSNNYLTIFPNGIKQLHQLKLLNLADNQLEKLDLTIGDKLTNLEYLNLSYNNFKVFPKAIFQFKKLKTLRLAGADSYDAYVRQEADYFLEIIPAEITVLTQLEILDLSFQSLQALPPTFYQLSKLHTLNLRGNYLKEKEVKIIAQLNALTSLNLGGNGLKDLPSSLAQLQNLKILALDNVWLEGVNIGATFHQFPKAVFSLKNLETLILSGHDLKILPAEIGQLKQLKILDLYGNFFMALPNTIHQLTNLETLNIGVPYVGQFMSVADTPIQLSNKICSLKKLKTLGLSGRTMNGITKAELERLKKCLPTTKF